MVAPTPKAIFIRFQVLSDNGKPLGNVTSLEADTELELRDKFIAIYTEAVRAMHRFRQQRDEARRRLPVSNIQQFRKSTES